MEVDRNCADVSESVPDCPPNGEVDWLDLDGEAQAIEGVLLDYVELHRSEATGNELLPRATPDRRDEVLKVIQDSPSERVRKPDLG